MEFKLIYAQTPDGAIGYLGPEGLPWYYREDLQHFKNITSGHSILMGRHTMDTFPKLLPNRFHYVLTRGERQSTLSSLHVNSIEEASEHAKQRGDNVIIGIGGGYVINALMGKATEIYRSILSNEYLEDNGRVVFVSDPVKHGYVLEDQRVSTDGSIIFEKWIQTASK